MPTPLYQLHFPDVDGLHRTDRDSHSHISVLPADSNAAASDGGGGLLAVMPKPGIQSPQLVSSYSGSIDELLFMLPAYIFNKHRDAPVRSLIRALPVGTKFIVATHESLQQAAADLFSQSGHDKNFQLVLIPDEVSFSDWAEDAFLGVRDTESGRQHLLEPFKFGRGGDSLVADFIEDMTEVRATSAPLIFQGGNCLIGDTFWLMGEDYFADTYVLLKNADPPAVLPSYPNISNADILGLFAKCADASRDLIRVYTDLEPLPERSRNVAACHQGTFYFDHAYRGIGTYQPIFHIDMFITLVGRPSPDDRFKLMVGSPRLASDITGIPLSPYALQTVFDDIASILGAQDFDVIRNPLPVIAAIGKPTTFKELKKGNVEQAVLADFLALGAKDDTTIVPRDWYHATSNNCLVQRSKSKGNHVYLPTFGNSQYPDLAKVDQHMKALWEDLGFTAHMLGDCHSLARRQGVVHCIKKYLARGD